MIMFSIASTIEMLWLALAGLSYAQTITTSFFLANAEGMTFDGYITASDTTATTYVLSCIGSVVCPDYLGFTVTERGDTIAYNFEFNTYSDIYTCVMVPASTDNLGVYAPCTWEHNQAGSWTTTTFVQLYSYSTSPTFNTAFSATVFITPEGGAVATQSSTHISQSMTPTTGPSMTLSLASPTTKASKTSSSASFNTSTALHSSAGLSTGAKAGISVSIIAVALLGLRFFFFLRLRRNENNKPPPLDQNPGLPFPDPHELITSSNTHELKGDEQTEFPLPATQNPILDSTKPELDSTILPTSELGEEFAKNRFNERNFQELDPQFVLHQQQHELPSSDGDGILPAWVTRAELEAQRTAELGDDHQALPQPPNPSSFATSPIARKAVGTGSDSTDESSETEAQKEARLKILTDRIERIRVDKERLEELRRLTEIEEATKREIMDLSREGGGAP